MSPASELVAPTETDVGALLGVVALIRVCEDMRQVAPATFPPTQVLVATDVCGLRALGPVDAIPAEWGRSHV